MDALVRHIVILFLGAAAISGCSLVDEDLSDCVSDQKLNYELRLVTNLTTELKTQLSLETDVAVSTSIEKYLKSVFTNFAHDVDLSFYDVQGDSARLYHESHIMDANQSSYKLSIPVRHYMHLAVANVANSRTVALVNGDRCHEVALHQQVQDTLDSQTTGLFTARLPMNIQGDSDQQFNVRLFMANCSEALLLDTLGSKVKDIRVFACGFATDFNIADSTYTFAYTPLLRTNRIPCEADEKARLCYSSVNFPSREMIDTRADADSTDPDVDGESGEGLWEFRVYVTLPDNKVTENKVRVHSSIRPGQFRLIKAKVRRTGELESATASVGISVVLDWKPGMEHEIDL